MTGTALPIARLNGLQDAAAEAYAAKQQEAIEYQAAQERQRVAEAVERFREAFADSLGIDIPADAHIDAFLVGEYAARATYMHDGIEFTSRFRPFSDGTHDLFVVDECAECHGTEGVVMLGPIHSLAGLGEILSDAAYRESNDSPPRICEGCAEKRREQQAREREAQKGPPPLSFREQAEQAAKDVEVYAIALAAARAYEDSMQRGKPIAKSAAILRLMETENPETKKQHTASSAEKVVETDQLYAEYLRQASMAVVHRIEADGRYEAAKARAIAAANVANCDDPGL